MDETSHLDSILELDIDDRGSVLHDDGVQAARISDTAAFAWGET